MKGLSTSVIELDSTSLVFYKWVTNKSCQRQIDNSHNNFDKIILSYLLKTEISIVLTLFCTMNAKIIIALVFNDDSGTCCYVFVLKLKIISLNSMVEVLFPHNHTDYNNNVQQFLDATKKDENFVHNVFAWKYFVSQ